MPAGTSRRASGWTDSGLEGCSNGERVDSRGATEPVLEGTTVGIAPAWRSSTCRRGSAANACPSMDSTEFHAMFHEAATRGWSEDELRQLPDWVNQSVRRTESWPRYRCATWPRAGSFSVWLDKTVALAALGLDRPVAAFDDQLRGPLRRPSKAAAQTASFWRGNWVAASPLMIECPAFAPLRGRHGDSRSCGRSDAVVPAFATGTLDHRR